MSFKIKNFLPFSNIISVHLCFTSWIHIFWHFLLKNFEQIPTLRARPKNQLSSGSPVVEDYKQQNQWDYTQQNPQIDYLDPNFEKTTMTTYKSKNISKLVRPRLTLKYIHIKQRRRGVGDAFFYYYPPCPIWLNWPLGPSKKSFFYICWCYYAHRSRDLLSPICRIFLFGNHPFCLVRKNRCNFWTHTMEQLLNPSGF